MKKIISETRQYFLEALQELKKVNWLNRKETLRHAAEVLILSFIIAFILGFFDYGLMQLIRFVIK